MAKIKGIDVSTHNENVDWKKVKKDGISFVIVRAGFGNSISQKDKYFEKNIEGALAAGLNVGIYWFSYARSVDDAKKEADVCLEVIKKYKDKITYPVFFDFEYASEEYVEKLGATVNKRFVTDVTKAFCDKMKQNGFLTGYYTNQDYYKNKLYPDELASYDLWLADYTGDPAYPCAIQQYSSEEQVNGVDGNVDANYCFKQYKKEETPSSNKIYGTCTGDGVRVRSEAHTAAKILATANSGDKVELLGDDDWGWSKVKFNGVTGWMCNMYIKGSGRSKLKTLVCNGTNVNVRQSASKSAKVVKQLNKGNKVSLISINPGNWLDIGSGFVYYDKSYLKIE